MDFFFSLPTIMARLTIFGDKKMIIILIRENVGFAIVLPTLTTFHKIITL